MKKYYTEPICESLLTIEGDSCLAISYDPVHDTEIWTPDEDVDLN